VNARLVNARSRCRRFALAGCTAALLLVLAAPAGAAHRARLSADLADHLVAGSPSIQVIVHGTKAEIDALATRYNLVVKRRMKSGAVLQVTAGQLDALAQDESVDHLSGDIKIRASDVTTEAIGADQVWEGVGGLPKITGAGVTVALIDSGINLKIEANGLKKRVLATFDFTGGDGLDRYGHGTHVAGIIAGQPGRTSDTRQYSGVAPGAFLVNLRVLGDDGSGSASDVIEAIDWAIDHKDDYNIRVINLSLGAPVLQPYRDDPLCEAVERAVRAGVTVVAAAGNFGKLADGRAVWGGIISPGNSPWAITVGALDTHGTPERSDDTVASYSSRGPTRYDLVLKPDLVAPGSHIVSTEAVGSVLSTTYPDHHVAGNGPNAYLQLSGTSMAAGVVSGAVALVLGHRSTLSPRNTKVALQLTSSFNHSSGLLGAGDGSLNVIAAVEFQTRTSKTLPITAIAEETVECGGVSVAVPVITSDILVWGSKILVWGNNDILVWGNNKILVWGDILVWGSRDILVWGSSDILVWGSGDFLVWDSSKILVWGDSSPSN